MGGLNLNLVIARAQLELIKEDEKTSSAQLTNIPNMRISDQGPIDFSLTFI